MPHYVYVLEADESYKIGVSADIGKRIKQLQTGNSNKIQLYGYITIADRTEALRVEKLLHRKLESDRLSGEWFGCYIGKIVQEIILELGPNVFNFVPPKDYYYLGSGGIIPTLYKVHL